MIAQEEKDFIKLLGKEAALKNLNKTHNHMNHGCDQGTPQGCHEGLPVAAQFQHQGEKHKAEAKRDPQSKCKLEINGTKQRQCTVHHQNCTQKIAYAANKGCLFPWVPLFPDCPDHIQHGCNRQQNTKRIQRRQPWNFNQENCASKKTRAHGQQPENRHGRFQFIPAPFVPNCLHIRISLIFKISQLPPTAQSNRHRKRQNCVYYLIISS